jgi:hypothetical protein
MLNGFVPFLVPITDEVSFQFSNLRKQNTITKQYNYATGGHQASQNK